MKEKITFSQDTKILKSASEYNIQSDKRLLIPFTNKDKIGFIDSKLNVIVKPQYDMYYGDCYSEEDLITVSKTWIRGFARSGGDASIYTYPLFGKINYKGDVLIDPIYLLLQPAIGNNNIYTVQNKDFRYGVLSIDGKEIVPFGKYSWISGFDKGFARVIIQTNMIKKMGLIDENGNEVLPVVYDNIWNFYNKNCDTTTIIKGDKIVKFRLI